MERHFVAGRDDVGHHSGETDGIADNDEEGCPCAAVSEDGQDPGSVQPVRAVVEGQREDRIMGAHTMNRSCQSRQCRPRDARGGVPPHRFGTGRPVAR